MNKKKVTVSIIGGGVSGLTTGITLQLMGYDTTIYTIQRGDRVSRPDDPLFASLYPSASVIPHSVYSENLEKLFTDSQAVFYELRKATAPGITMHRHYELFEFPAEPPGYTNWMLNFRSISADADPLRRGDDITLHGWLFDCLFADWTFYYPALYKWYEHLGGIVREHKVKPREVEKLDGDIIVNGAGFGSHYLFDDPIQPQLVRGHILHVRNAPLIRNDQSEIISYNYTPTAEIYSGESGRPCDLYCYPRKDGWIVGGSRQKGTINDRGEWNGETTGSPSMEMNGITFPAQIYEVNKEILSHSYNLDMDTQSPVIAYEAYRYIRSEEEGLRLELSEELLKPVIHNYGHGGAGVTLSWGCALEVLRLIEKHVGSTPAILDRPGAVFDVLLDTIRKLK